MHIIIQIHLCIFVCIYIYVCVCQVLAAVTNDGHI